MITLSDGLMPFEMLKPDPLKCEGSHQTLGANGVNGEIVIVLTEVITSMNVNMSIVHLRAQNHHNPSPTFSLTAGLSIDRSRFGNLLSPLVLNPISFNVKFSDFVKFKAPIIQGDSGDLCF